MGQEHPYNCIVDLAGVTFRLELEFEESEGCFSAFMREETGEEYSRISVTEDEWSYVTREGYPRNAQNEASIITALVSDKLLEVNRCIVHAAAVRDMHSAWLIAAASGVGKSTQVRTLEELYPGEFSVICGDRPILELKEDGSVFVHPSPWNGKEDWHGADGAPLSGMILLKRGEENRVAEVKKKDAALRVFDALIMSGKSEDIILKAAGFENELLSRIPVYEMTNRGVPDSTRLLYDTVLRQEASDEI